MCLHFFEYFYLGTIPIALKLLNNDVEDQYRANIDFFSEATMLRDYSRHPNIVQFFGIYIQPQSNNNNNNSTESYEDYNMSNNRYFLVTELMDESVLDFLLDPQNRKSVGVIELLEIAIDAATGMNHLAANEIIHRDLAGKLFMLNCLSLFVFFHICCRYLIARNLLLKKQENNKFIVKVGDFGLARDVSDKKYYRPNPDKLIPFRYCFEKTNQSNTTQ